MRNKSMTRISSKLQDSGSSKRQKQGKRKKIADVLTRGTKDSVRTELRQKKKEVRLMPLCILANQKRKWTSIKHNSPLLFKMITIGFLQVNLLHLEHFLK